MLCFLLLEWGICFSALLNCWYRLCPIITTETFPSVSFFTALLSLLRSTRCDIFSEAGHKHKTSSRLSTRRGALPSFHLIGVVSSHFLDLAFQPFIMSLREFDGDRSSRKARPKLAVKCRSPMPSEDELQKYAAGVPYATVVKG